MAMAGGQRQPRRHCGRDPSPLAGGARCDTARGPATPPCDPPLRLQPPSARPWPPPSRKSRPRASRRAARALTRGERLAPAHPAQDRPGRRWSRAGAGAWGRRPGRLGARARSRGGLRLGAAAPARGPRPRAPRVRFAPGGVEVAFRGARIGRPGWAGPGDALTIESGRARFSWSSVLRLRPLVDAVELDHPVVTLTRDAQGRPDWTASAGSASLAQPIVVRRLTITHGRLAYTDASTGVRLDATVTADPDATDGMGLHVDGQGAADSGPWRLAFRSSAVGLGERVPMPLQAQVVQGRSRFAFRGELPPELDAAHLHGALESSGPDLHDLARLLRIPFPHTAPYRLQARLERAGPALRLLAIRGRHRRDRPDRRPDRHPGPGRAADRRRLPHPRPDAGRPPRAGHRRAGGNRAAVARGRRADPRRQGQRRAAAAADGRGDARRPTGAPHGRDGDPQPFS